MYVCISLFIGCSCCCFYFVSRICTGFKKIIQDIEKCARHSYWYVCMYVCAQVFAESNIVIDIKKHRKKSQNPC